MIKCITVEIQIREIILIFLCMCSEKSQKILKCLIIVNTFSVIENLGHRM